MATISSLSAPGVELREKDNSLRAVQFAGTTVGVVGFASQGPVGERVTVSDTTDFKTIFGVPTNPAERYFYYTARAILKKGGAGANVICIRLPYGANDGDNVAQAFTLLAYPAIPMVRNAANTKGYDHYETTDTANLKAIFGISPTSGTDIAPSSVSVDMILDSAATIAYSKVKLTKIAVNGNGFLPAVTDTTATFTNKAEVSYKLNETNTVYTTEGNICVEKDGTSAIVTIAVPLVTKDSSGQITSKLGTMVATAKYTVDSPQSYKFAVVASASVVFERVQAFKVADDFAGTIDGVTPEADKTDITYLIGAPAAFQISLADYYSLVTGELFKWENTPNVFEDIIFSDGQIAESEYADDSKFGLRKALKHAAFIAVNTSRSTVNDSFEGYFLGATDNIFNTPDDNLNYISVDSVKVTRTVSHVDEAAAAQGQYLALMDNTIISDKSDFLPLGESRMDFALDTNNTGSVSRVLQTATTAFDTSTKEYDDTISLALFKLTQSSSSTNAMKLSYSMVESFNGSLGKQRVQTDSASTAPVSYFISTVSKDSPNLSVLVNPYIAEHIFVDYNDELHGKVRFFSNKLLKGYELGESRYLTSAFSSPRNNSVNKSLMAPIRLAKSNLASFKELSTRVGVDMTWVKSNLAKDMTEGEGTPDYRTFVHNNAIYPFGIFSSGEKTDKTIGNVPVKVENALACVSNDEEVPELDILVEGGLGTIYAYSKVTAATNESNVYNAIVSESGSFGGVDEDSTNKVVTFDDTIIIDGVEDLRTGRSSLTDEAEAVKQNFMAVQNAFLTVCNSFANGGRGDVFYIPDVLRGALIKGKDTKVEKLYGTPLTNNAYDDTTAVKHSWNTSVYWVLNHLFDEFTSSYSGVFAQWFKVNDETSDEKIWVPASGYMAALFCAADSNYGGPWYVAAGLNRGIIDDVVDVAINPTQKQRGDLYKICINSVPKIPNVGATVMGIRTLSKKASAFDQINCRRTFLYIEKRVKATLRYYLFEPNNEYTRLAVYNELEPMLSNVKTLGGIYNFVLQVDEKNNDAETINSGTMAVDISAAATRASEFIVLNMTSNRLTSTVSTTEYTSA